MKWPIVSAGLLALLAALGYWYVDGGHESVQGRPIPTGDTRIPVAQSQSVEDSSPFTLDADMPEKERVRITDEIVDIGTPVELSDSAIDERAIPDWGAVLDEQQLGQLVDQLRSRPALFQQLVDEFRQTTDYERKEQLTGVLGEVGGEQSLLLASELIFSGDTESRTLGMNLLQELQPGSQEARDIVSGMLATEVEPPVLIEALTALVTPGDVDPQSRAYLSDQIAWLSSHQDEDVRSISLNMLSRWSDDARYTDVLVAGLDDTSEYVRSAAAYALAKHEDKSPVVIERLFMTLRQTSELKKIKRAAVLALRAMPLSSSQTRELDALEKKLNTVRR